MLRRTGTMQSHCIKGSNRGEGYCMSREGDIERVVLVLYTVLVEVGDVVWVAVGDIDEMVVGDVERSGSGDAERDCSGDVVR